MNFGEANSITTSTPVTINIIFNGSQLDAGSLIQAERNKKAFKRIQNKTRNLGKKPNVSPPGALSPIGKN